MNRDPAVWEDPDRFDAGRFADPAAPPLLTFGAGPHYCRGAALARVTLEECLRTVVAAWYELMEAPDTILWRSAVGRSPARLLVTPVAG